MIYLFSQIIISLCLAAITGGAIGWLIHRSRANKQIAGLYSVISKQSHQVNEAQTQVSLISDDYNDLKHRSTSAIEALTTENQQIPELKSNLENSQLVANQLIQKHKSESVELINENKLLAEKAKLADDREKALDKMRAEFETEKRRNKQANVVDSDADADVADAAIAELDATESAKTALDTAESETADSSEQHFNKQDLSEVESKDAITTSHQALNTESESESARITSLLDSGSGIGNNEDDDSAHSQSVGRRSSWASHSMAASSNSPTADANERILQEQLNNDQIERLFDPVDQHDDLKQIFGIGPLTEKTLNKLGITSYSQLADLKQHDIEKIADALHIIPGRIERDNWVGNARTQLEDVLESL